MKKIILGSVSVTLLGILIFACKKEPETVIVKQERGYVCENFTCKFVEEGATYLTLLDCKSECADKRPGNMEVNASYLYNTSMSTSYTLSIAFAATADDMAIGAYIDSKSTMGYVNFNTTGPISLNLTKNGLAPGNYYYRVQLQRSSFSIDTKTGVLTVAPAATVTKSLELI